MTVAAERIETHGIVLPPIAPRPESNSSDEYDTDMELEAHDELQNSSGQFTYKEACLSLNIPLSQRIKECLSKSELRLQYRNLGVPGAEALALALVKNNKVQLLDLEENSLGGDGGMFIADMLNENKTIQHLNISKNKLGSVGALWFGQMLKKNKTLLQLNFTENEFGDRDAEHLAAGIQKNESLVYLNLSRNAFSELGAGHLARALANNDNLEFLDLSWNQLRRRGSVTICKGIMENSCLLGVNLSWNGFAYEGSMAVGELLKRNHHLRELDISNNRINWKAVVFIAQGIKKNTSLQVLKIGHNPLTMTGCLDLLEAIQTSDSSIMHLGFEGIPVSRRCMYVADQILKVRTFSMVTGGVLEGEDTLGRKRVIRGDPMKIMIQYLSDHGVRPLDLFRTFTKDETLRVTKDHFIRGLKKARVPLTEYEMKQAMDRIVHDEKGHFTYVEMARGMRQQLIQNREDNRKRAAVERKKLQEFQSIMKAHLPPIAEQSFQAPTTLYTARSGANTSMSFFGVESGLSRKHSLPTNHSRRASHAVPSNKWNTVANSLTLGLKKSNTDRGKLANQSSITSMWGGDNSGRATTTGRLPLVNMSAPLGDGTSSGRTTSTAPSTGTKKKKKKKKKKLKPAFV